MKAIFAEDLKVKIRGREILKGIELEVEKGKILGILGPSGSGKSTLLRCINRLIDYVPGAEVKGRLEVLGIDAISGDPFYLRRKIGTVFQEPNPLPHLTIFENVALPIRLNRKVPRREVPILVRKYLEMAMLWEEMRDRLSDLPGQLSGGQQQRLCLARALALEPEILLLDEPTANLDPENTAKIEECILSLAKEGKTIVFVTHFPEQAMRLSDLVALMKSGRIVKFGEVEEVLSSRGKQFISLEAPYFGGIQLRSWRELYEEMERLGPLKIYYPICGGHLECVEACSRGKEIWEVLEVEIRGRARRRPYLKDPEGCLRCFKCLAACPTGALMKSEEKEPKRPIIYAIRSLITWRKRRRALSESPP